jgi:hypothetical protein
LNRRKVKKEIFEILKQAELSEIIAQVSEYPRSSAINSLFMALCDPGESVRWHAVSCFGELVGSMAETEPESARVIMRRFLWTLNDESGGIGWGAPEAMAQIMCKSSLLREEYIHMLISYMQEDGDELFQDGNYLELPMIQRGLLWGIGTLCHTFPEEMKSRGCSTDLSNYMKAEDQQVRRLALWALSGLEVFFSEEFLEPFKADESVLNLYIDGVFLDVPMKLIYQKLRTEGA